MKKNRVTKKELKQAAKLATLIEQIDNAIYCVQYANLEDDISDEQLAEARIEIEDFLDRLR